MAKSIKDLVQAYWDASKEADKAKARKEIIRLQLLDRLPSDIDKDLGPAIDASGKEQWLFRSVRTSKDVDPRSLLDALKRDINSFLPLVTVSTSAVKTTMGEEFYHKLDGARIQTESLVWRRPKAKKGRVLR